MADPLDNLEDSIDDRLKTVGSHDYRFDPPSAAAAAQEGSDDAIDKPVGKRGLTVADLVKLAGLVGVFALVAFIMAQVWPTISGLFEEGGVDAVVQAMQQAGPLGVLMLLGLQVLQVIVAFIPGEVVQVAAGLMYGPLGGGLIVLVGAMGASALVYSLVHWLGAPFVRGMVPVSFLEKFRAFEASGRLDTVVFILFLIPGLPKDTFTYLVPLTDMKLKPFLLLSTLGRAPGIFLSAYAASSVANGDMTQGIIVFVVVAVIAVAAILLRDRIMERLDRMKDKRTR